SRTSQDVESARALDGVTWECTVNGAPSILCASPAIHARRLPHPSLRCVNAFRRARIEDSIVVGSGGLIRSVGSVEQASGPSCRGFSPKRMRSDPLKLERRRGLSVSRCGSRRQAPARGATRSSLLDWSRLGRAPHARRGPSGRHGMCLHPYGGLTAFEVL